MKCRSGIRERRPCGSGDGCCRCELELAVGLHRFRVRLISRPLRSFIPAVRAPVGASMVQPFTGWLRPGLGGTPLLTEPPPQPPSSNRTAPDGCARKRERADALPRGGSGPRLQGAPLTTVVCATSARLADSQRATRKAPIAARYEQTWPASGADKSAMCARL